MSKKRKLNCSAGGIKDIEDAGLEPLHLKQLEIMREWREGKVADVDIYGCDKLAEEAADAKVKGKLIVAVLIFIGG